MNMWEKRCSAFSLYINLIAGALSLQSWECTLFDIKLVNT